jgi:hypothetical protein
MIQNCYLFTFFTFSQIIQLNWNALFMNEKIFIFQRLMAFKIWKFLQVWFHYRNERTDERDDGCMTMTSWFLLDVLIDN